MSTPYVGFIGLGLLGSAIVKRLLEKGHRVIGYDVIPDKVSALTGAGLVAAASPAELCKAADVILMCVTTSDAVADVVKGSGGIVEAGKLNGKVLVDHSTTDISITRTLALELFKATGMTFVDAPVSGGPEAAAAGTLAIMAGGETAVVESVRPVMELLGRFTRMGEVGAGQATKLVNQTLVLSNYCVIAEALRLAQAFGVDASQISTALEPGHAGSNLLPVLLKRMVASDFTPSGYARQVLKDLEMLQLAASDHHLAMPMASQALTMFRMLVGRGDAELDGSAVVTLLPQSTTPIA